MGKNDVVSPREKGKRRMKVIEIAYPEALLAVLNLSPEDCEHEAKMALAVKLFALGRLTSGQAARLAGVPRLTFLLACHRFGVPSVLWDRNEIEAEFRIISRERTPGDDCLSCLARSRRTGGPYGQ